MSFATEPGWALDLLSAHLTKYTLTSGLLHAGANQSRGFFLPLKTIIHATLFTQHGKQLHFVCFGEPIWLSGCKKYLHPLAKRVWPNRLACYSFHLNCGASVAGFIVLITVYGPEPSLQGMDGIKIQFNKNKTDKTIPKCTNTHSPPAATQSSHLFSSGPSWARAEMASGT